MSGITINMNIINKEHLFTDCSLEELKNAYLWYLKGDVTNENNSLSTYWQQSFYKMADTIMPNVFIELEFLQAIAIEGFGVLSLITLLRKQIQNKESKEDKQYEYY